MSQSQRIRLPSINELTSKSPITDSNVSHSTSTSPKLNDTSRILPAISTPSFRYPQTTPSNYVFTRKPKLSPTIPYESVPVSQNNYQYYQYSNNSYPAPPPPPPPQQIQQVQQQGPPVFYQPIYYQPHNLPQQTPANIQYAVPEVINRPTNKCHRCGTTETPEWRRGPNGVRTLCNACGLFHAKLVKRKGAALAAEEVLNNKVTKGKNGRRILIKKHELNENIIKKTNHISGGLYGPQQVHSQIHYNNYGSNYRPQMPLIRH